MTDQQREKERETVGFLGMERLLNHPNVSCKSQLRLEQALFFANKQHIGQASGIKQTKEAKWADTRVIGRPREILGPLVMSSFSQK
jgi:hypothetical protein